MMIRTIDLFAALASCALMLAVKAQIRLDDGVMTREQVIANYDRRREHLKTLFAETKEKVTAHDSGKEIMEEEEYAKLKKRVGLYEKKLQTMEGPMDDREIELAIQRAKARAERRHLEL